MWTPPGGAWTLCWWRARSRHHGWLSGGCPGGWGWGAAGRGGWNALRLRGPQRGLRARPLRRSNRQSAQPPPHSPPLTTPTAGCSCSTPPSSPWWPARRGSPSGGSCTAWIACTGVPAQVSPRAGQARQAAPAGGGWECMQGFGPQERPRESPGWPALSPAPCRRGSCMRLHALTRCHQTPRRPAGLRRRFQGVVKRILECQGWDEVRAWGLAAWSGREGRAVAARAPARHGQTLLTAATLLLTNYASCVLTSYCSPAHLPARRRRWTSWACCRCRPRPGPRGCASRGATRWPGATTPPAPTSTGARMPRGARFRGGAVVGWGGSAGRAAPCPVGLGSHPPTKPPPPPAPSPLAGSRRAACHASCCGGSATAHRPTSGPSRSTSAGTRAGGRCVCVPVSVWVHVLCGPLDATSERGLCRGHSRHGPAWAAHPPTSMPPPSPPAGAASSPSWTPAACSTAGRGARGPRLPPRCWRLWTSAAPAAGRAGVSCASCRACWPRAAAPPLLPLPQPAPQAGGRAAAAAPACPSLTAGLPRTRAGPPGAVRHSGDIVEEDNGQHTISIDLKVGRRGGAQLALPGMGAGCAWAQGGTGFRRRPAPPTKPLSS